MSRGIPAYRTAALILFIALDGLQCAISLLTFIGLQKIGAARSQPPHNSDPLWSALIAVIVMHETASLAAPSGTLMVVAGVVLISLISESAPPGFRGWHVIHSLGACFLVWKRDDQGWRAIRRGFCCFYFQASAGAWAHC